VSDEELRALERRTRESGAVEDGVVWLRARQRAGTLDENRLRFAAVVGHPAAMALTGVTPAPVEFTVERRRRWWDPRRAITEMRPHLSSWMAALRRSGGFRGAETTAFVESARAVLIQWLLSP
jgi:hypothetical protein